MSRVGRGCFPLKMLAILRVLIFLLKGWPGFHYVCTSYWRHYITYLHDWCSVDRTYMAIMVEIVRYVGPPYTHTHVDLSIYLILSNPIYFYLFLSSINQSMVQLDKAPQIPSQHATNASLLSLGYRVASINK